MANSKRKKAGKTSASQPMRVMNYDYPERSSPGMGKKGDTMKKANLPKLANTRQSASMVDSIRKKLTPGAKKKSS